MHYSAQLQLPDTMSKEEKKERADFTIREMGLQDAINTRIGGWGCKGIKIELPQLWEDSTNARSHNMRENPKFV